MIIGEYQYWAIYNLLLDTNKHWLCSYSLHNIFAVPQFKEIDSARAFEWYIHAYCYIYALLSVIDEPGAIVPNNYFGLPRGAINTNMQFDIDLLIHNEFYLSILRRLILNNQYISKWSYLHNGGYIVFLCMDAIGCLGTIMLQLDIFAQWHFYIITEDYIFITLCL